MEELYINFTKASQEGDLEVLRKALKKDVNRKDEDGMTPVHWAANSGNLEALRILIGKGGDPDKPNNEGATSLHLAAGAGQLHCLVFLTNFGGNVHAVDDNGITPLQVAAKKGRIECMRHLESIVTHQIMIDRVKVEKTQAKAKKEAEKRIKEKAKLMQKLDKDFEKRTAKRRKALGMAPTISQEPVIHHDDIPDTSHRKLNYSQLTGLRSEGESNSFDSSLQDDENSSNDSFRRLEFSHKINNNASRTSKLSDDIVFAAAFPASDSNELSDSTDESQITMTTKTTKLSSHASSSRTPREAKSKLPAPGELLSLSNGHITKLSARSLASHTGKLANGHLPSEKSVDIKSARSTTSSSKRRSQPGQSQAELHMGPLYTFLHVISLDEFREAFAREKIDLRACLLCTENDLREIGLPLGPRKKILDSIAKRNETISQATDMNDVLV